MSPMPQLDDEGKEKSGISRPEWRRLARSVTGSRCGIGEMPQEPTDALGKRRFGSEQAEDEIRFARKIEKVARVDQHAIAGQQLQHEVLFGVERWHLEHRVPSTFGTKNAAPGSRHGGLLEALIVDGDSGGDLRAGGDTTREQFGRGKLCGRRDRQIAVADELESIQ